MFREFALIRVKKQALRDWEFPVTADELPELGGSLLAGRFDGDQLERIYRAIGTFPFARKTGDGRRAWRIAAPKYGVLEVWFREDGRVLLRGELHLNLVYGLYVHLVEVCPEIAVEDRITGVLHNRASLLRLVRHEEERRQAKGPSQLAA
jgi:hypothetical protein